VRYQAKLTPVFERLGGSHPGRGRLDQDAELGPGRCITIAWVESDGGARKGGSAAAEGIIEAQRLPGPSVCDPGLVVLGENRAIAGKRWDCWSNRWRMNTRWCGWRRWWRPVTFPEPRAAAVAARVLDLPMDAYLTHALTKTLYGLKGQWEAPLKAEKFGFEKASHLLFALKNSRVPQAAALVRAQLDQMPADNKDWLVALAEIGMKRVISRGFSGKAAPKCRS